MKKIYLLAFSCGISLLGIAQQNFFNIPSGDITLKGKVFYQHQLNVYSKNVESKGHFVYGLGKGWDVGVNLVGKGFYFQPNWRAKYNSNPNQGALYPMLMPTLQKQFMVKDNFAVNLGTQVGWNLSNKLSNKELLYYNYALGIYYFNKKKSRVVAGAYQTTNFFVGNGNTTGAMLGYEINLSKRWYLMGDWVSGRNDAGVGVFGFMYNVSKRVQFCSGVLVPNGLSDRPMGVVLELNLLGWDVF